MNFPTLDTAIPSPGRSPKIFRSDKQKQALLIEYPHSGLSKANFCKKHKISTSTFYKWQKDFSKQQSVAEFVDITDKVISKKAVAVASASSGELWQVELDLGSGIVLRVRTV